MATTTLSIETITEMVHKLGGLSLSPAELEGLAPQLETLFHDIHILESIDLGEVELGPGLELGTRRGDAGRDPQPVVRRSADGETGGAGDREPFERARREPGAQPQLSDRGEARGDVAHPAAALAVEHADRQDARRRGDADQALPAVLGPAMARRYTCFRTPRGAGAS